MGLRRIIVLLIALVAAGGSAMYARSWIEGQQATIQAVAAPAPKEQIHEVLVADAVASSNRNTCAGSAGRPMTCPKAMCSRVCARTTR